MAPWLIWIIAAGVLLVIETLSLDMVFAMIAGGALAAALAAGVGGGWAIQIVVFGIAAIGLLLGVRPLAKRHMLAGANHPMGIDALVGKTATVVVEVGGDGGRVKIGGDVWTAEPYIDNDKYPVGTKVKVMEIRGATAVVWPGV
ncbi:MAG: NfeD family protein [Mycobacteriales bacterium]